MNEKHLKRLLVAVAVAALLTGPAAFNACGYSNADSTDPPATGPVPGLTVTPGNTQITLSWDPVPGTTSYDIYWKVSSTSSNRLSRTGKVQFQAKFDATVTQAFWIHNGLHNGWTYTYCVVTAGSAAPPDCSTVSGSPSSGFPCLAGAACQQVCRTAGLVSCDGGCVNLANNATNCGACGNGCEAGEICSSAACIAASSVACTAPTTNCGGGCFDLKTSVSNCGACGNPCPVGASCQFAQCACPVGQTVCGGVCVDLMTDINNCGACGNSCANIVIFRSGIYDRVVAPQPACSAGRCNVR